MSRERRHRDKASEGGRRERRRGRPHEMGSRAASREGRGRGRCAARAWQVACACVCGERLERLHERAGVGSGARTIGEALRRGVGVEASGRTIEAAGDRLRAAAHGGGRRRCPSRRASEGFVRRGGRREVRHERGGVGSGASPLDSGGVGTWRRRGGVARGVTRGGRGVGGHGEGSRVVASRRSGGVGSGVTEGGARASHI